ncbi:MAG: hypothetical protein AVDCRST_MAG85-690 [uncultured Solirubrobacteraceae bacterium]|uniref:Uncharacterized protein n=1 Tax=uncultured Solirubrobacteraceae bacterium TaxID=1162706 RepID=A0A6J4RSW1_9ACTN|nr:MAG: hypothetical protein AVDCRST_MAG85-690 [uncultured Solirubrobacteraceae bacterium]
MSRALRLFLLALAVAIATVAGVAAASALTAGDNGHDHAGDERSPGLTPDGGPMTREGSEADPRGGPPWTALVFESETGRTCWITGRVKDGRFGSIQRDGTFVQRSAYDGANCADLDGGHYGVALATGGPQDDPDLVSGVVDDTVRRVSLLQGRGSRELRVSDRGSFVAVLGEKAGPADIRVQFAFADGSTEVFSFDGRPPQRSRR